MKHSTTAIVALLMATALLFTFEGVAHAEETTCAGALGAVTVDNLRVAPNTTCTLTGTTVQGTVKVESNARLIASNIHVIGNIQAEGAAEVRVTNNSSVGGSIQIKQGGSADIANTAVTADIQFESNRSALRAASNTVGGNIQIVQNSGGVSVTNNVIDGNLQCKENTPAPIGSGNVVKGSAEDQCANLTGSSTIVIGTNPAYLPLIRR